MATGLWLIAIGMFIASNPAVQMLKLSQRFAAAATDEQRSQAVAAGQTALANWEGSAFQVSYAIGQLSGILIAIIMLRTSHLPCRRVRYRLKMCCGRPNVVFYGSSRPWTSRAGAA